MLGYGSFTQKFKPEPNYRAWEFRGTIAGILIALSGAAGPMVIDVGAMFVNMRIMGVHLLVGCQGTVNHYGRFKDRKIEAWVCEYLEAYVLGFPDICLVALLLFLGRQMVHHRFYYGMLKAGGVLNYHGCSMLKDPVLLLMFWCFAHVLCYACFIAYIAHFSLTEVLDKKDDFVVKGIMNQGAGSNVKNSEPATLLTLFVKVCGIIILPAGFFLVFLCTHYSMGTTLVELSEYVGDSEDAHGEISTNMELASLTCMGEGATKRVVEAETWPEERTMEEIYALILERFRFRTKGAIMPESMSLLTCLWPLRVLLSTSTHGQDASSFRWLWCIFVLVSMLFYIPQAVRLTLWVLEAAFLGAWLGHIVAVGHLILAIVAFGILVYASAPAWRHIAGAKRLGEQASNQAGTEQ